MPTLITSGSMCRCSFGTSPCPLNVLPTSGVTCCSLPAASIQDYKPLVNLSSFGMCSNPANPAVAAATAAALGVLTPVPCIPATVTPWTPGSSALTIGGVPALTDNSKLLCSYPGGIIEISTSTQQTVTTSK